jgi:hypothetical protein
MKKSAIAALNAATANICAAVLYARNAARNVMRLIYPVGNALIALICTHLTGQSMAHISPTTGGRNMVQHNEKLKQLLRETGRDNDPFKDVGTLNATERVETDFDDERFEQDFAKVFAPHTHNARQNEGMETL